MKKPVINEELCIGCGVCVSVAPDVFEMNDENKATVKADAKIDEATVQDAIDQCPVQAISWEE